MPLHFNNSHRDIIEAAIADPFVQKLTLLGIRILRAADGLFPAIGLKISECFQFRNR